jgi:DNA-binding NtrC family response regulator
VTVSAGARARLKAYAWPGNVRQLKALVRRVVILASPGHEVGESELELDEGRVPTTLLEELAQAERRRIAEAAGQARGSRTEAAKALGMPRTTLINKLKRYGLE